MLKSLTILLAAFLLPTDSILVAQTDRPDGGPDSILLDALSSTRLVERHQPPHLRHLNSNIRFSDQYKPAQGELEKQQLFGASIDQPGNDAFRSEWDPMRRLLHPPPSTRTMTTADDAGRSTFQSLSDSVQEAWVRHYASGLSPSSDQVTAMVIDDSGNVYVTGCSDSTFTGFDYLTIKYNADGVMQWRARHKSPDNGYDCA